MTFPNSEAGGLTGAGIGLRSVHTARILAERPGLDWLEILYDNFQAAGGPALRTLEALRAAYPFAFHCVGLDLGTVEAPDHAYLERLRAACDRFAPALVSAHLCWTAADGVRLHDLLPLPYTEEALAHVAARIAFVQDFLGRRILIENVSAYLAYATSTLSEMDFVAAVAERADCSILFDVNNAYVNQRNHGADAGEFLERLPGERIAQMHLGGFEDQGNFLLDTHGAAVCEPVWDLFARAVERFGPVPVSIERDNNIPPLEELLAERARAAAVLARARAGSVTA